MKVFLNFVLVLICLAIPIKTETDVYEECSNDVHIQVNKRGEIYSPGYRTEKKYPLSVGCVYRLTTDPGKRIKLTFEDFELERTEQCEGDFLRIYGSDDDEAPLSKVLCGYERPRDILSSGNVLHIIFFSDFMISKRGYHLVYTPTTDETICPGQFSCRNRKCVPNSVACNKVDDCEDGSDEVGCGYPVITPPTCGQPTIQPKLDDDERIVGGYEVIPGSWPWQAELQMDMIEPSGHVCGGSLINNQWVLTAAHCVEGNAVPELWRIHLGKHHKFQRDDSEQVRYLERIVVDPEIPEGEEDFELDLDRDIALLKLQTPVTFTDKVKTVCLPTASTVVHPGTECYAMGWGETRGTGGNEVLKQTKLIILEPSECNHNPMIGIYNESVLICAGIREGRHGPCHGDSGGPLVCRLNNRWTIVGLASTVSDTNYEGALCGGVGVPATYTKISNWVDWIDRIVKKYS